MLRFSARVAAFLLAGVIAATLYAQSFYPERLEDKTAVYVTHDKSGAAGDGVTDDTASLQKAIDTVADTTRQGIVFLPSGRYRITHTLYVWPGVRVIGYGEQRPVLYLAPNTMGYESGPSYMVMFTGGRPAEHHGMRPATTRRAPPIVAFPGTVPPLKGVIDANPGTFYSAMSNIDIEIGDGNPGAVGIRFHVAQHCFLTHMNFHIGSGMAALHDIGNEAEDLHFFGGRFGIMTGRPSPGWQFTLLDSSFDGQREAAIREHEAGLVLIHDDFRNVPAAVDIEAHHIEELWMENSHLENISGPAILISEETSRLTEINFKNVVCKSTPVFARLRASGKVFTGKGNAYRIVTFTHGLSLDAAPANTTSAVNMRTSGIIVDRADVIAFSVAPADTRPAIARLPLQTGWTNAQQLGAKGDGNSDDTAALQKAIDTNRIVYLPSGRYRLTDTLRLRPDSVLIGLHPSTTQLDLEDNTPGFNGAGAPKALLLAPQGGATIVTGIGLWTGGINNLASGAIWMSGKDSLMDDVRFLGGHGTNNPDGSRMNPYNSSHGGDPNPLYRWDAQYPSLWVTKGGGGTFADIWTPDTFAQAGLYVSDTKTEGHVYELSSEHHVRNEVKLLRTANWEIVALQTEEERGESGHCLPLAIQDSQNITVAEMHAYRVVSSVTPFPETIHVGNSRDIRFRNLHIYSDSKAVFDSSVRDDDSGISYRELEVAALTLSAGRAHLTRGTSAALHVKQLASGFFNASSLTIAPDGLLYFVDTVKQHIYCFTPATKRLEIINDHPIDPANLFFDKAGDMMIVSYDGKGTVYVTTPAAAGVAMQRLIPQPAIARPGMTPVLPIDHWRFDQERASPVGSMPAPRQYVSPDGTVFLPAGDDFVEGALYYGVKMADVLRGFALRPAIYGRTFYVSDEGHEETYAARVNQDGSLRDVRLFANRGGEGVAAGPDGRVYLAAGQVYIYTVDGKLTGEIDVPERPTGLIFSGHILYILARTTLYSVSLPTAK
jgi:sugar lactone lactonase YvrE